MHESGATMVECAATTARSLPCRAPARVGSTLCYFHDPEIADRRSDAASRGGRAPRRIGDLAGFRPTLDSPEKIAAIVESYIGGLASGRATASQVKAVTGAAHVLLQALEAGHVRKELDELRAAVKRIEELRVDVPR